MNVAYIINDTVTNGGATKALRAMLNSQMERGIQPIVIVPDKNGVYKELVDMHIPVYALTYRPCAYPKSDTFKNVMLFLPKLLARIFVNRQAYFQLTNILQAHKIDLVHTNVSVIDIGYKAARKVGIPHIYHIREYADLDFGYRYFPNKSAFLRQLDTSNSYSICITKDIQRYHRQEGRASSRVIYDGIRPPMDEMPHKTPGSKDYFLFAGRLYPGKGLGHLLMAYASYVKNFSHPLPLYVAGSQANILYTEKQKQFIAQHGLESHVTLLGERDDIAELMRNAKALIIPSQSEGFGFCMPEAMFQGCLAIGRNTGGTKEQLDNGLSLEGQEIAFRYETTEELTRLLQTITEMPDEALEPYRTRAFKVVNSLYTTEKHADAVNRFYHLILHEKNN